jgi:chromosome transmission fidelity protein 18
MFSSSPPNEPLSDELAEIYAATNSHPTSDTLLTSYSDDLEALHDHEVETKRVKVANREVVQHRSWKVSEVFHSEPQEAPTSSPIRLNNMPSSPPLSPSPVKKRKLDTLDFGKSSLGGNAAAAASSSRPVKAQKIYYGINIHQLLQDAEWEDKLPKPPAAAANLPTPPSEPARASSRKSNLLWTEKYRAKKFTDLIGDERTHRHVMHWLKRWDQIVFPGAHRAKPKSARGPDGAVVEEKPHRKILLLTGPPGLGKTTLAHVCAKQAGYEVQEVNASDERSSGVVKGRIRDMVGTENVKNVDNRKAADGMARKVAKPVCVIIDEVDGVVGGSGGGGEGGFVKALIDLVMLDQKNSAALGTLSQAPARKQKGDRFRLLRPLILVCNDVYHPSLRPLRQSSLAEIIHVRKPPISSLVSRLQTVFEKEGVPCDSDGVRKLCEATWGVSNRKEDRNGNGSGEGDMRGIMVVGEWVAGKLRSCNDPSARLTRKWVEDNILQDLSHGGGASRGLGRGGPKDIVERVFKEGAGFPKSSNLATPIQTAGHDSVKGVTEGLRRTATERLRALIDTHGDTDRIMTDCFSSYPEHPFQDDTYLSKPSAAYEWLHFHDRLSSAVFSSSEWELAPYLSTPVLAFHHLFASATTRSAYIPANETEDSNAPPPHPFSGPGASWAAHEAQKANESHLHTLQSALSLPLTRLFSSPADIATDLHPYLLRMLTPHIHPTIIGGSGRDKTTASVRKSSEQILIRRAINAMGASGVRFERVKLSAADDHHHFGTAAPPPQQQQQWIYRMEPPLDSLGTFETGGPAFGDAAGKQTRYAVRQVLDQEWAKEAARLHEEARLARFGVRNLTGSAAADDHHPESRKRRRAGAAGDEDDDDDMDAATGKKAVRDFFGRPVVIPAGETEAQRERRVGKMKKTLGVWVTFHEGYSNAVRKPLTLGEFLRDL